MFYAWGEGVDGLPQNLLDHSATARSVQAWNHPWGQYYLARASLATALWLAVLALAGISLLLSGFRRDLLFLALTSLGIAAFVLVFQGRSRYVLPYAPVLVALAVTVGPIRAARLWRRARG
jgi:hypothetical protein